MKLKHIHIDSYKIFQDFDLDFCHAGEVQNIVVITGENSSGKTTLLRDVIAGIDSASKPRGCVTIEDNGKIKTFTLPISPSDERYRQAFSNVISYSAGDKSSVAELQQEIVRYVDQLVSAREENYFEAYCEIQNLIDDIFSDFDLQVRFKGINEDKQLVFSNLNGEEFGMEGLSGGERQILSQLFPLFTANAKGRVILIDEPESSLHPSWQLAYMPVLHKCARNNDCQFVLATHSPQIISSAYKEEVRIFTRNDKGAVEAGGCFDGPYGWTVDKVLLEIQGMKHQRVHDVEKRIDGLNNMLQGDLYDSKEFKEELSEMESLLGYPDRDLALIRMEAIRKRKKG